MTQVKDRCATVKGIFLAPGVSRNGRLYDAKNITAAVARMNAKLTSGTDLPLNMATGHSAADKDDALSTIGRITKVSLSPDFTARFEADIADTVAGRDIAALVTPKNPYIRGVSIRGAWIGDMRSEVTTEGISAITADDLEVSGVDFTGRPGVGGAVITSAVLSESALAADPTLIYESVESVEFIDEAGGKSTKSPYGAVSYADPGYQSDGKKRYPIDTAGHARAAWSYINVSENASKYTGAQVKAMKSKIKRAAKKLGIDITSESTQLVGEFQEVLEAYASMCIDNGAATINVSGTTYDAEKLAPLATRLALAAIAALAATDPDEDGDVDLVMPDGTQASSSSELESFTPDNDDDMGPDPDAVTCPSCGDDTSNAAIFCPTCGKQLPAQYSPETAVMLPQAESSVTPTTTKIQEATVPEATPTETAAAEAAAVAATAEADAVAEAAATAAAAAEAAKPVESVTSLTSEDIKAIGEASATALAAALAPLLATLTPPAAPVEAAPAAAAVVAEAVAPAEAAPVVAETVTYTAAETDARIAAAVAEATKTAIDSYRAGSGSRKGFVSTSTVQTAAELAEGGELDPKALAEMDQETFKRVSASAWSTQPYKFARGTKAIAAA